MDALTDNRIIDLADEADEYADAQTMSVGEYHPDWHSVRDIYFARAIAAEQKKIDAQICNIESVKWVSPKYSYAAASAKHCGKAILNGGE